MLPPVCLWRYGRRFLRVPKSLLIAGILGLSAIVVVSGPAKADLCEDAQTTVEISVCLGRHFERVDAELNRVYRRLISRLDENRRARLRAAQRAWVAFRDRSAEFAASAEAGGSLSALEHTLTLISLTDARTLELKAILQKAEGH